MTVEKLTVYFTIQKQMCSPFEHFQALFSTINFLPLTKFLCIFLIFFFYLSCGNSPIFMATAQYLDVNLIWSKKEQI